MQCSIIFKMLLSIYFHFVGSPFNWLFLTKKFLTDRNLETEFNFSIHTFASDFNFISAHCQWQKLVKNFPKVFRNIAHNSFVVENANGKLIVLILFMFHFQICVSIGCVPNVHIVVVTSNKRTKLTWAFFQ